MSETQELRFSVMPGVDVCCRTPAGAPYALDLIKVLEAPIRQFQRMQSAPLLREFARDFIECHIRESSPSVKHAAQLRSRVSSLIELLTAVDPNRNVSSLDGADVTVLRTKLHQQLERYSDGQGSTLDRYYSLFNRLVRAAKKEGYVSEDLVIESSYARPTLDMTPPFSLSDLQKLFDGYIYQVNGDEGRKPSWDPQSFKFWLVPLGAFCGLRLNEICQLQLKDVQPEEAMWTIHVNDDGKHQSIKNPHSRRKIPVSQLLIDMGFLEFVEERRSECEGRETSQLFPELSFNEMHLFSRQASRFLMGYDRVAGYLDRSCGVATSEGGWGARSLRRTFAEQLRQRGVSAEIIADLLGHADPTGLEVTRPHYAGKTLLAARKEVLELHLNYGLILNHVRWCNYREFRRRVGKRKTRGTNRSR
ncbi:tyrosine-type recombinase/integrase [Pseudomonas sp. PDM22]|uniref:tyrosine-type recombinase/integrase n=1 Tax=Pseudomonas sp. PDM22 TaxID=2769287 RepID=UPI001782B124|nr:tyrosine-type recombinase/integrase [Pseudomonas sp. PDM22]MBD9513707.1 tyrosine-type recombinase/integrase [Pseudomonas sp. PDM22]